MKWAYRSVLLIVSAVMMALVLLSTGCAVWQAAGVPLDRMNVAEKLAFWAGPGH